VSCGSAPDSGDVSEQRADVPLAAGSVSVDELADWSKVFARSAGWTFDASNPSRFEGDTTRIKRQANSAEWVTYYRATGLASYAFRVHYFGSLNGRVAVETSADGNAWSSSAYNTESPVDTGGGWYRTNLSATLDGSAKYVRLTFSNDSRVYAPQLSRVSLQAVVPERTDELGSWSGAFDHSGKWTFDASNPQYFEGDVTRIKRTEDTPQHVTYFEPFGIRRFSFRVNYLGSLDGRFAVHTSSDGSWWTTASVTPDTPVATGGSGWTRVNLSGTTGGSPKYVRLTLQNDSRLYTPQLSRVTLEPADVGQFTVPEAELRGYNYAAGTQTIGAKYHFTSDSPFLESAKAMHALGSNIMKFNIGREPQAESDAVLGMGFKYYFLWFRSSSIWWNGLSATERDEEYRTTYDMTRSLLTRFNGTGKEFYLGHWEGDWYLLPNYDTNYVPTDTNCNGMVDWFNVRQDAIEAAKRDVAHNNVAVFQYAEVNRVRDAMEGKRRVANCVLPRTRVDYVSYSAYDVQEMSQANIDSTLNYLVSQLPAKSGLSSPRVFIGEFGLAAIKFDYDGARHEAANRTILSKFLRWGAPFVLYWEMYNNEITPEGAHRGFWLIDNYNAKQPLYYTFQRLYTSGQAYARSYYETNGVFPSGSQYRGWAADWLSQYQP
jgi:hypothetical protein